MHRIALRNSARKVALAAVPRVRLPTFIPFIPLSTFSIQQNSAVTARTYATAKPGLYFLSLTLTGRLLSPSFSFNVLLRSCIRGFLNTRVPHLGRVPRWKRRGDRSRFECVGFHALGVYHPLNYLLRCW